MFDKSKLEEITKQLCTFEEIKLEDIPEMSLYMEQLLSFLNPKLDHYKNGEKHITKTMINNYTKGGVLMQSRNKKYSKQHIILLILVFNLKNILSIDEIKRLFAPLLNDINTPDDDLMPLQDIYRIFLELKMDQFGELCQHFIEKFNLIKTKTIEIEDEASREKAEMFLLVLMLVAQANASRQLAEKIIGEYF